MRYSTFFTSQIIIFLLIQSVCAQHNQPKHDHGEVNFETSCNADAQDRFEYGLGMLHHMMYEQAADIFNEAVAADEDCAIAYWGIAMTKLHPLWAPPTDKEFERGKEAIERAVSTGAPTDRERGYIQALHDYYSTANEAGYREGLKAWKHAHENLYAKYPEDIDAGAFYGLSLLATAPPDDETFSQQKKAGALLEELHEKAPEHPGLFHYIIHAYDNPVLAEQGVEYAHKYDKLAPEVPHALHMPAHIFVRVGKWDETIDWNRRSADAALNQPVGNKTSFHHAHALDYMIYAYLQQGLDEKAGEVLDELKSIDNYQHHFAAAYAKAATPARYLLEQKEWEKATTISPPDHNEFPWEDFPQYEAITWWARGLGAARINDFKTAREAIEMLKQLREQTQDSGQDYWASLVDVQRKTIEAWMLHEKGQNEKALALMREAAEQEDSVDKHPVTPSEVLPARELLGDMLLLQDKPKKALAAYEAALEISPNRFNSLYGAGKAAEMAGKADLEETYFEQLYEVTVPEESERPELEEVAASLAK